MEKQLLEKRKKIIYDLICDSHYVPMKRKDIAVLLNVPRSEREALNEALDALTAEGKIRLSPKGKYSRGESARLTGVFTAHVRGFGFADIGEGEEDIFIGESHVNGAIHGDLVQIELIPSTGKRREGKVVKVLEHGLKSVVGTFEQSTKNYGFVRPDNPRIRMDIFVPAERSRGAVSGHKVVVEFTSYGENGRKPEGKVTEILGHVNDPGTDILSLVKAYGFPVEFSEKVLNQAERAAKDVTAADMAGRLDLRDWQTVTIDGEDAKDLDDAVTVRRTEDGYELGVHIADVANYVQERSALDVEALRRGTSVYLADRVIPMLPHRLSNGICSLNQGEDRLTLSCIMKIDEKGNIVDHRIAETVIRVDRRMNYTDVNRVVTFRDEEAMREYEPFLDMLSEMKELAELLRARRKKRGSIDFDFPETKLILDEAGRPLEIMPYERNAATRIIEEFMLAANETVAEDYFWQGMPFLYRTHEKPDTEKIRKLGTFINNFGYRIHMGSGEVHPKELQKLLEKIRDTPAEGLISRLTLRSMKQARYAVECVGHFGLAAQYYCHFTSPIRRYPDLQIHRVIKDNLRGRMDEKRRLHYEKILPDVAKQSSELERRADEAERETVKLKKAEYMEGHIGETFTGVISGITKYGLFVELPNTVEGMVPVSSLPGDYYHYIEETYEMTGERTGKSYRLGQTVEVIAAGADRALRTVDFTLKSPAAKQGQ